MTRAFAQETDTENGAQLQTGFEQSISQEMLNAWIAQLEVWFNTYIFTWHAAVQVAAIVLALLIARATRGWCSRLIGLIHQYILKSIDPKELQRNLEPVLFAFVGLFLVLISQFVLESFDLATALTSIAINLLVAWVVIRTASSVIREPFWSRTIAFIAFGIAALNIFGLLDPTVQVLDGFAITIATTRISILFVMQAITLIVLLIWGATFLSGAMQRRIETLPSLTPSVQLLIGNITRITLITLAVFIALTSLGIDLSVLAVVGGAVGIGIGFGLQKIVGNFISGIILLIDRSIKPGDVIEVKGTYGWVKSLGARYTSVVTRDGHEHLVPNEEFIVNTVTNWSFTDRLVRVKKPIGVSYNSDVRKAQALVIEAALAVPRVLKNPEPKCLLTGFGDNSVDLEVRFWLSDPENGVSNVSSEVLLGVWDRFHEAGIEIPYPQRDIHIKQVPPNAFGVEPQS